MLLSTDVIVMGSMGDIGPQVVSSLRSHGLDVLELTFPQNTLRDEWGYRRVLSKSLKVFRPKMILPVGCPLALAGFRDRVPEGVVVPLDDIAKLRLLDSKISCSDLAARAGVPQPRFFENPEAADGYQVIFKRDKSFGGSGVFRPKTKDAIVRLIEREPSSPYLIEEYIEGEDYSIDIIRHNGEMYASCYKALSKQGQGPARERVRVDEPLLINYASEILSLLDFEGICGMDFRRDLSGCFYFLECNPRFTGGIDTQIKSGFDIPFLMWSLFCD